MERPRYTKKMKQMKNKKLGLEERSPLQQLSGLQIRKKSSNLSSSSSSSVEAPKGCLGLLLSSNSSSASSASSSRTHLERKHKALPKVTTNVANKSTAAALRVMPRSKENQVPRKTFSQISKNAKPAYTNAERFKLSSATNKSKKGSAELVASLKISHNGSGESPIQLSGVSNKINLHCIEENCTPAGKIASFCVLDSVGFDNHQNVSASETDNGDNSAKSVKTPPIEASVSPEIQCGSESKMLVCNSAATPVCYGAGHLLSGVTDKRKCRRIGSLKGGCEKIKLIDDEKDGGNVIRYSQDPPIPLLADASVHWWLSPCDEGHEDRGSDSENMLANASPMLDLSSSPPEIYEDLFNLGCNNGDYNGSGVDNVASKRNARINVLSDRKDLEIHGVLESSNEKKHDSLMVATPNCSSSCRREGKDFRHNVVENNSSFSLSSFSSGNVIRTPNSDGCIGRLLVEVSRRNLGQFEVDSITETLNTMCLSPRIEENGHGEGFQQEDIESSSNSISLTQLSKNANNVCSWASDSTLENLELSQMRISWKDGLVSRIDENDEFDCCCCLSDEEVDANGCYGGDDGNHPKCVDSKENYPGNDSDVSPIRLDYEPCIAARGKEKLSPHRHDSCAESICTNGGDLVASGDSDWTYFKYDYSSQP